MKTSTALRKARALVNKGWCRGAFTKNINGVQCYCAVGALSAAITGKANTMAFSDKKMEKIYDEAAEFLTRSTFDISNGYYRSIVALNDGLGGSKQAILAAYDLAIKMAVNEEK